MTGTVYVGLVSMYSLFAKVTFTDAVDVPLKTTAEKMTVPILIELCIVSSSPTPSPMSALCRSLVCTSSIRHL